MKKCTSTTAINALPFDTLSQPLPTELVLLSNYPITKFLTCSIDNNKFPENILNINENDLDYATCIETPCEPPSSPVEKPNIMSSTFGKNYLQLSIESAEQQEKYVRWLFRIRRGKRNKNPSKDSLTDILIDTMNETSVDEKEIDISEKNFTFTKS